MAEPGYFIKLPHNDKETRIFEASYEDYVKHNPIGYWGKVTATIDWCERQYQITHYIAEFFNTISNVFYLVVAFWLFLIVFGRGHEKRHALLALGYLIIGIGSTLYHGTLLFEFQILDELPMLISILTMIWSMLCIDPKIERKHKRFFDWLGEILTLSFLIFCYIHWQFGFVKLFQTLFGSLTLFSVFLIIRNNLLPENHADVVGNRAGKIYGYSILTAAICWLIDQVFCVELNKWYINPQLHAFWHFFTAVGCLYSGLFLLIRRSHYFGEEPRLEYAFGFMPYVVRGRIIKYKN